MGSANRYDGVDGYAVTVAKYQAGWLVRQEGFSEADRAESEQILVWHFESNKHRFDAGRGSWRTFVDRVVRRRALNVLASRRAAQSHVAPHDDDSDIADLAPDEGAANEEALVRRLDVARVLATLPPSMRDLCRRLATDDVGEIAQETNRHRSTIYEAIGRIRRRFEVAGIESAAPRPPTDQGPSR